MRCNPPKRRGKPLLWAGFRGWRSGRGRVDGALFVDSPVGGPTLVTLVLPFAGPQ
ncbi:hypothetical protein [Nocardia seriolae]|uniref:hypothetical protein n=1 Tax=Nocardia seriolae TaxID=37332 RepID=UPI00210E26EE|nr:hypothetical protein [Nocardia seriolae]